MLASKLALHLILPGNDFRPPVTPLDVLANVELGIGAILIVVFTLLYGIKFKWYKTLAGASIFALVAAISLLEIFSVITRILTPGDYLFRDLYRVIVYALPPAAVIFLFVALFVSRERMQRELRIIRKELPVEERE